MARFVNIKQLELRDYLDASMTYILPSSIPEAEVDWLLVDHDVGGIVVKNRGDVVVWKRVSDKANEHACLADGTITNDHALQGLHCLF